MNGVEPETWYLRKTSPILSIHIFTSKLNGFKHRLRNGHKPKKRIKLPVTIYKLENLQLVKDACLKHNSIYNERYLRNNLCICSRTLCPKRNEPMKCNNDPIQRKTVLKQKYYTCRTSLTCTTLQNEQWANRRHELLEFLRWK